MSAETDDNEYTSQYNLSVDSNQNLKSKCGVKNGKMRSPTLGILSFIYEMMVNS